MLGDGPSQLPMVEAGVDRWLHDLKVGREIEITRGEEAVVANVQDLAPAVVAGISLLIGSALDAWQDRIAHALERLRDQRGTYGTRGLTGPQGNHLPAPAHGHGRCRQQEARKIDDVAHVVRATNPLNHVRPRGLREVLDRSGELLVALDEQDGRPVGACGAA